MLLSAVQSNVITRISVAHHTRRRVIPQDTFDPAIGISAAVTTNHHAKMLAEAHADATTIMQRHPSCTAGGIQQSGLAPLKWSEFTVRIRYH